MKRILRILPLLMLSAPILAQSSCCVKPNSSETFALLTNDKQFVLAHLEPEPYLLTDRIGEDIVFKTPNGKEAFAYEIKSAKKSDKYVFVFHEWWGLNDYVKDEAVKIFSSLGNDVNVIAIDLYNKKVATSRDSASKYMAEVKNENAEDIIIGIIKYVGEKAKVATIGWCFGGGWSLQSSILEGKQAKACVMYYGMPEEKTEKIRQLKAPVLFVFAKQDKWINKEVVDKFEAKMKEEKKPIEIKSYDAVHGFANPSNPKFAKEYAEEAFKNSIEFIKMNLK